MRARFVVRVLLPFVGISIFPLVVGALAAWNVHKSQKRVSNSLAVDVAGMRAGEELAIGIRDVRTELNRFLATGDRQCLDAVRSFRREMDHWLVEAQRTALTERERGLIARLNAGYRSFFADLDGMVQESPPPKDFAARLRQLMNDTLAGEILEPAQQFLDLNEEQIAHSNEENQHMSNTVVLGLLLLGLCGTAAGFGIAWGISRSIVRLSVPIRDVAGKLNEVVGPITLTSGADLEEMEKILRKMAVEIGAVVDRLQESRRDALRAEQLAAVGQMAAGIAHELRNPLTAMKVLVQAAALRSPPGAVEGKDLAVLDDEMTRLEQRIKTFLDFARPPQMEKQSFEMRRILMECVDLVAGRAERQGVRIRSEVPDEPATIQADMGQMRQVVLNLLLNALDAMPQGGELCLRLGNPNPEGSIVLQVLDSGGGLPPTLGQRLFEPFVSTKETGSGLGLSICKRIVEAHGGEVMAANRATGGAIFTVRLPAALASPPEPAPVAAEQCPVTGG